jgi:hypothetical protein
MIAITDVFINAVFHTLNALAFGQQRSQPQHGFTQ